MSRDSNVGVPRVSCDTRPQKYPLQLCSLLVMFGQVMSKVPMLVAAGPLNGFLILVWYVMIIIIILEYDDVIIND